MSIDWFTSGWQGQPNSRVWLESSLRSGKMNKDQKVLLDELTEETLLALGRPWHAKYIAFEVNKLGVERDHTKLPVASYKRWTAYNTSQETIKLTGFTPTQVRASLERLVKLGKCARAKDRSNSVDYLHITKIDDEGMARFREDAQRNEKTDGAHLSLHQMIKRLGISASISKYSRGIIKIEMSPDQAHEFAEILRRLSTRR